MMSAAQIRTTSVLASHHSLRLRLKPKGPITGYVDGAWWPRSRDLTVELPVLLRVLTIRLGSISRVIFAINSWDSSLSRIEVNGRRVHLEGFRSQDNNIVHVLGLDRQRISLLVIPPKTAEVIAHTAMLIAARRDNTDSPTTILSHSQVFPGKTIPEPRSTDDDSQNRWEVDGGHLYEHG